MKRWPRVVSRAGTMTSFARGLSTKTKREPVPPWAAASK